MCCCRSYEQEEAVICQPVVRHFKERLIIFVADVFHEADGNDAIKRAGRFAVIDQLEF